MIKNIQKTVILVIFFAFTMCAFANNNISNASTSPIFKYWTAYGNADFAPVSAMHDSLAFNNAGAPYAAVIDANNNLTIMTLQNGATVWTQVGQTISNAQSGWDHPVSIAFDQQGVPYIDYLSTNTVLIVLKLNVATNQWVQVGNLSQQAPMTMFRQSLVINNSGVPYVCFYSLNGGPDGYGASIVEQFNGQSWVEVGNEFDGSASAEAPLLSLAINANETTPSVGSEYLDTFSVWSLIKNQWTQSSETIPTFAAKLVVNSTGTPYVAYEGNGVYNKIYVAQLNGTTWQPVGTGSANKCVMNFSFAISPADVPFIEYAGLETSGNCNLAAIKAQSSSGWQSIVQSYNANTNTWDEVGNINAFPIIASKQLNAN